MHPQKHGNCSRTSGISFATWYAARAFGSSKIDGESTSAANAEVFVGSSVGSLVPRNDTQPIATMMAMAAAPNIKFCLLVDFNDSPLRLATERCDNGLENEENFAFFFVV